MKAHVDPIPFDPLAGFLVDASEGTPPYHMVPAPSPPNPPGVELVPLSETAARVTVSPPPPPDTEVLVLVTDSSVPPQTLLVSNRTM